MPHCLVAEDGSVAGGGRARLDQVGVSVSVVLVGGRLDVVTRAEVVGDLVTEAVVSEGAGLLDDGQGVAAGAGGHVRHAAVRDVHGQQGRRVRSVPQLGHRALHLPELELATKISQSRRGSLLRDCEIFAKVRCEL